MGALMNDNDHMKDNSRDLFEQEMRDVVPLKQKQVDNSHSYSRVLSPAQVERRRAAALTVASASAIRSVGAWSQVPLHTPGPRP